MLVSQFLWFARDMEPALRFYTGLIPGSRIDRISPMPADTPSGPAGSVRTAAFTLGDQRYQAIEAGPLDPFNRSFSIVVACDDQDGIDRVWDALTDGGAPGQCGWLTDRWGLSWQIVPRQLATLIQGTEGGRRAMQAMLKMGKLDIAALEQAAAG